MSGLAKTMLQGIVYGKRRKGRQKKRWENNINPIALRKAKIVYKKLYSECNRVKEWAGMD